MNNRQNRLLPGLAILLICGLVVAVLVSKQSENPPRMDNWTEGWRQVTGFQIPRRAPAAVVQGNYLYVIGGVDEQDRYVHTVEYTLVKPDGNLQGWKKTSELREGRFYLGAASDGKHLYALGGGGGPIGDDNVPLASVEIATIRPDGSLGEWQHHSYLTTPRRGLKVEKVNGHLLAIGGYNGQFLRSTEHLDLNTAQEWVLDPNEANIDRYIHASARRGNRLYILGGHVEKAGEMSYGDVETTTVDDNGNLTPWQIAPSNLIQARFIATAFSLGDYLYIAGGHDGIRRLDSVEMSPIGPDGNPGIWKSIEATLFKRSAAATAIAGNRVYLLGGMDDSGVLNSVETAVLGLSGSLGYQRNRLTNN